MSASLGILESLLLLAATVGTPFNDLVSWIDPADYFQSRKIEVEAGRLADLAGQDPRDGKAQTAQLLAIRWLGEHPDQAKKVDRARAVLEAVAAGKKAQDPQGFARDYARRALALLDGKPAPAAPPTPAASALGALAWFPADVTACGVLDLRTAEKLPPVPENLRRALTRAATQSIGPEALYRVAESAGNVRLDRIAFAVEMEPDGSLPRRIYLRFTGAMNHQWFAALLRKKYPDETAREGKGRGAPRVTVLTRKEDGPALALVGDTDLIAAGYEGKQAAHQEVVEKALRVRAAGKGSVVTGPLGAALKKVPAPANLLMAAELTPKVRKAMAGAGFPLPVPRRYLLHATMGKVIAVRFRASLKDADEAREFVEGAAKLKAKALEWLKEPPGARLPAGALEPIRKAVAGVKVEADGAAVRAEGDIPVEVIRGVLRLLAAPPERGRPRPKEKRASAHAIPVHDLFV